MALPLGLTFFLLLAALAATLAHAVLAPVATALAGQPWRWQMQTIDALSLLLVMQLPLAYYAWQFRANGQDSFRWLAIPMALGLVYAWFRGVGLLSQLGIRQALRRVVFVAVLIPFALFGSLALVFLVLGLGVWLATNEFRHGADFAWLAVAPLGFVCLILARWLTRWVLAGAER